MFTNSNIIIIGAGASGIAAASKLIANGFNNVTILEASDRIGGRINTVEFADGIVDLGAQWAHGEDNIVFNLATNHNLTEYNTFTNFNFFTSKGEQIPEEENRKIVAIYDEIENNYNLLKVHNKPYGDIFTKEFCRLYKQSCNLNESRMEQYLEWASKLSCAIQCCDSLNEVSAKKLADYKTCPGDLLINFKTKGYKSLLELFMKKDNENNIRNMSMGHIQFNKQVQCIDNSSHNDVIVTTTDGTKYKASHVIFTPSLGVLKEQHTSLFKPLLPEKKRCAIENIGIGVINKFFLEFPNRWLPSNMHHICFLWSREDKAEFIKTYGENYRWLIDVYYFISLPYQPRVLCGWISGPLAKFPELLTDNVVKKQLLVLLNKFVGDKYTIPEPINMIRTNWFTNKLFRGSYSFQSTDTEKNNISPKDLAEPVINKFKKPVILFAGEATHSYYYSTVHGAIETGYREASRIINYYK